MTQHRQAVLTHPRYRTVVERMHDLHPGFHPLDYIAQVVLDLTVDLPIRLKAAEVLAQYMAPRLKHTDHSGQVKHDHVYNIRWGGEPEVIEGESTTIPTLPADPAPEQGKRRLV